jgi:hypothetical protein
MAGSIPVVPEEGTGAEDWVEPDPAEDPREERTGPEVPVSTTPPPARQQVGGVRTPLRMTGRNIFGQGSTPSESENTTAEVTRALVMLAEIQQQMLAKDASKNPSGEGKKVGRNLNVKLPEFRGGKGTTTKEHRAWRKMAMAHMQLHKLDTSEMALLVYLSVTGEARETLEILEVNNFSEMTVSKWSGNSLIKPMSSSTSSAWKRLTKAGRWPIAGPSNPWIHGLDAFTGSRQSWRPTTLSAQSVIANWPRKCSGGRA